MSRNQCFITGPLVIKPKGQDQELSSHSLQTTLVYKKKNKFRHVIYLCRHSFTYM